MLPLDSPRWNELKQAYGTAEDIPVLIQTLAAEPGPDHWNELWGYLCHQGSVYSATYAAFPHLVEIARSRPAGGRLDLIHFLGFVAAHRDDTALLPEFREEYERALPEAAGMCLAELRAGPEDLRVNPAGSLLSPFNLRAVAYECFQHRGGAGSAG